MLGLVDYENSDDESYNHENNEQSVDTIKSNESPKIELKTSVISESKRKDIAEKCKKFQNKHMLKTNYIDENYYLQLELELGSDSVQDENFVKPQKPVIQSTKSSTFNIPEPVSCTGASVINLHTDFLNVNDDDDDNLPHPSTFNLNLIKEDRKSEIPANYLISGGLLTMSEQAGIKRKQNIDIGTVVAKQICMDDLTADRPIDMKPALTAEEMSKFKSIKEDVPDRNATRQHQITYLAHKAREKEFEMMTRISDTNFAQRESRSKYGF